MAGLLFLWLLLSFGNADLTISELNQGFPPKWDLVPGDLSDFWNGHGKFVINPWNYLERMGMYKILLKATESYLDMGEPGNQRNILWGLPLQHEWQFQTGRLLDDSNGTTCGPNSEDQTCISVRSWWACNCYSVSECQSAAPQAMDGWKTFFEVIKTSSQRLDTALPPLSKEEDRFLTNMWKPHVESINAGHLRCSKRLHYLSVPEGNFGKDWATAVEFIAATNFPTNFLSTNVFQRFLPHRKLVDGDKVPNIADFSEQENRVLFTLQLINKANTDTGGFLLKLWKKAMCSDQAKAEGRNLLQNLINNPELTPQSVIAIIIEMLKNPACKINRNMHK
ncbi:protein LEG1 homolog [Pyxicephalus adspersus]|uniref:protein LEG1 homolog n=1 Tax=Pyxicephalus adspersus TaxID=30357 RepID=UPI003B5AC42D